MIFKTYNSVFCDYGDTSDIWPFYFWALKNLVLSFFIILNNLSPSIDRLTIYICIYKEKIKVKKI